MQTSRPQLLLIIFFLSLFLFTACNNETEPVYTTISAATLMPGDPIPTPTEDIILTVTGKIGTTNEADRIVMDIPTIESLGQVEYTVMDPFKDVEITYTGVLMSTLLDLWQISPEATTLRMTALNDYTVDVPISLVRDYPVIFAMQADGEYMSIADKGPAMLVLPYNHFEFERPSSDSFWIWQIKSIDVN
jgi:hypothetical protein